IAVDVKLFEDFADQGEREARAGDGAAAVNSYLRAIALYRGELCHGIDANIVERERLRLRHLRLLGRVAEHHCANGDYAGCVEVLYHFIAADPYREDAHRVMMYCYVLLRQRAEAYHQFEFCKQLLHVGLDAEPEAATVALYDQARLYPESFTSPPPPDLFQSLV